MTQVNELFELWSAGIRPFRGELAALGAAMLWAGGTVGFSRLSQTIPPVQLNFLKGLVSIPLLGIAILLQPDPMAGFEFKSLPYLIISGVLGLGIGDTAFLLALHKLGSQRTSLMDTLLPPSTALLAMVVLQEQLKVSAWIGLLLTLLGILWVVMEPSKTDQPKDIRLGMFWALVSALCHACSAVLSRGGMVDSSISPLWATLIRYVPGELVVMGWMLAMSDRPVLDFNPLRSGRRVILFMTTVFFSSFLGQWAYQAAFKYTSAGIATTLSSTMPLFVLPITVALGEKVTLRTLSGVLVAVLGVWLLLSKA